ncbi:protein kinase domain-containing protein [Anabaena sp. WFMT]|uniref:protein kinase domain-containing protein n=1 Tax=Anabaena sp. WFMT TaxID=3449730 RepID=UPI003F224714
MHLQVGQKISNYVIEQRYDNGGFGIVYLAKDKYDQQFIIKILKDINKDEPNFDKFRQDFLNEGLRYKECIHPNIVKINELIIEGDILGIVMEYVEGENLKGRLLSEVQALKYIYQIGDALTTMHENKLLHQDVKPENIIVRKGKEEAILIDFGISRKFHPEVIHTYTTQMSDFYSPPELYESHTIRGPFTDVYCLSATLYKLLTNEYPEGSISRLRYGYPLKPPQEINKQISDNTNLCILLGLELEPKDRPGTIKEFLEILDDSTGISSKVNSFLKQISIQKKVRRLISDLSDDEDKYCIRAINDLGEFGTAAREAIPQLVTFLKHNQESYYQSAESTLLKIGSTAVLSLIKILENQEEDIIVRMRAAGVIKKIGVITQEYIFYLLEILDHQDAKIRWDAVVTIGEIQIEYEIENIVTILRKRLKDEEAGIRAYAAFALGKIGKDAETAIPDLKDMIQDRNYNVFIASLEALQSIGFDIESININFVSEGIQTGEILSGQEVIINHRKEQIKQLDEKRNKPGIPFRWTLSSNTPPQGETYYSYYK